MATDLQSPTVLVPADPPQVPALDGDVAAVRRCGADLLAASSRIDAVGAFAAGPARIPEWAGDSAVAYHRRLRPLGHRADAMSLALRDVGRRVDAHADALAGLHRRRGDLVQWRADLHTALTDLRERIHQVVTGGEDLLQGLRHEAEDLRRGVAGFLTDLRAWSDAVGAEETAMALVFSRTLTLEQAVTRYGDAPDPADAALASRPPSGASPAAVRTWWAGLSDAQREAVIAAAPRLVGNLDGVPAAARDAANRISLAGDLARLTGAEAAGTLTATERRELANARAAESALERVEAGTDPVTGEPTVAQLHTYQPGAFGGDGAIAVSVGDLDTADNVSVVVPGFGTDAQSAPFEADRAARLYDAARALDPSSTEATLAWIGYDAPDNLPPDGVDAAGVVSEQAATAGGDRLADALDGLDASRAGDPAHVTVVGHSYGSTTVGHAAADHGIPVGDVVVVGSPGLGGSVDQAGDLGVAPGHVWVGADSRDPIAYLGDDGAVGGGTLDGAGLGHDPAEDAFGAHRFEAETVDRPAWPSLGAHSSYFDPDSESLHDIAAVVSGHPDQVLTAPGVHDPWWGPPQDPEWSRPPTTVDTHTVHAH